MFVHRHSDGKDQFDAAMSAVKASPELVGLGQDGKGQERFTSREMIAVEQRLERAADRLAERGGHGLPAAAVRGVAATGRDSLVLRSEERRVGKECGSPCRSRCWSDHTIKKKKKHIN